MSWCHVCGSSDMMLGQDSSQYCQSCGAQSANYIEEAFDADDAHVYNVAFVRERRVARNEEQMPGTVEPAVLGSLQGEDPLAFVIPPAEGESQDAYQDATPGSQLGSQFGLASQGTATLSKEQLSSSIRKSYVDGLQKILQLQCESLVTKFGVTPLICGIVGPIWLKYVAYTRVFEEVWAEEALEVAADRKRKRSQGDVDVLPDPQEAAVSEELATVKQEESTQEKKPKKKKATVKPKSGSRKIGLVWLRALKERIPLSVTLALCFLACYIAREPVLPTDIKRWASKGQLPYLAAFVDISKPEPNHIPNTVGGKKFFPIEPRIMFKPVSMVGARNVELLAGSVAERLGLQLPAVNFHALNARFLSDLGLPVEKLSLYACRLYEWYTPSGLWLSSREESLPTRVYVMAMLIITIKILYNLDGCHLQPGKEKEVEHAETRAGSKIQMQASENREQRTNADPKIPGTSECGTYTGEDHLSTPAFQILGKRKRLSDDSQREHQELGSTKELLETLKSVKKNTIDYDKKLSTYLKYCRDIVFSGYTIDVDQELIRDHFWEIYEKNMIKVTDKLVADPLDGTFRSEFCEWAVGSHTLIGGIPEDSEGKQSCDTKSRAKKWKLQPRASDSVGSAACVLKDVPSAGRPKTGKGSLPESSENTNQKSKEKVLYTFSSADQKMDTKLKAIPSNKMNSRHMESQVSSSFIMEMKNAGFSCLPPCAGSVTQDFYMRYNYHVSDEGLKSVHADYFSVLQACGKLINVHSRALHWCVQILEKGLVQIETNVEKFLLSQDGDVARFAQALKRRKPFRRKNLVEDGKPTKTMTKWMQDLSFL